MQSACLPHLYQGHGMTFFESPKQVIQEMTTREATTSECNLDARVVTFQGLLMTIDSSALRSRLLARRRNNNVKASANSRNATLARRLVDAGLWRQFSERYAVGFDSDSGEFTDVRELAHALAFVERARPALVPVL